MPLQMSDGKRVINPFPDPDAHRSTIQKPTSKKPKMISKAADHTSGPDHYCNRLLGTRSIAPVGCEPRHATPRGLSSKWQGDVGGLPLGHKRSSCLASAGQHPFAFRPFGKVSSAFHFLPAHLASTGRHPMPYPAIWSVAHIPSSNRVLVPTKTWNVPDFRPFQGMATERPCRKQQLAPSRNALCRSALDTCYRDPECTPQEG